MSVKQLGVVAKKCGMTRRFTEERSIPVTVLHVDANRITQLKSLEKDGYQAVQVTAGHQKPQRLSKAQVHHFAKASVEPGCGLWEFRVDNADEWSALKVGDDITVDRFTVGQKVNVQSRSRGKGYAGTVKRHNFRTQDATHGNSLSHRVPGSTGQNQTPGRVFKGKKMAGQMGNEICTVRNLVIVEIDAVRSLLLVEGAVAGAPGADVLVTPVMTE